MRALKSSHEWSDVMFLEKPLSTCFKIVCIYKRKILCLGSSGWFALGTRIDKYATVTRKTLVYQTGNCDFTFTYSFSNCNGQLKLKMLVNTSGLDYVLSLFP